MITRVRSLYILSKTSHVNLMLVFSRHSYNFAIFFYGLIKTCIRHLTSHINSILLHADLINVGYRTHVSLSGYDDVVLFDRLESTQKL